MKAIIYLNYQRNKLFLLFTLRFVFLRRGAKTVMVLGDDSNVYHYLKLNHHNEKRSINLHKSFIFEHNLC